MPKSVLIIGNSDGIGLALTRNLIDQGWPVTGISRSVSPINTENYRHFVADIRFDEYTRVLKSAIDPSQPPDLCIYCAGTGELLNLNDMQRETDILQVNLLGMIETAAHIIPLMIGRGSGHFIGLSSVADELLSPEAPSYHAAKAGFSTYLESLGLALKNTTVFVTNVRFGFVDTKMAKGDVRPFMMTVEQAVQHILTCIAKKPIRYTAPKIVIPLVKFRRWILRSGI